MTDSPSTYPIPDAELGFQFDGTSAINPQFNAGTGSVMEHLAYAIAAAPADLLRHTQRIHFHYQQFDGEGLYSALLDLFIALNGKGAHLRRRLLMGAQDRLLPEHFAALARWLRQGQPQAENRLPFGEKSVLSRGILGTRTLVDVVNVEIDPDRDPLQEAREYIEYFQIEEARTLLEDAIFQQPEREELHVELAHLYIATRDLNRFEAMRQKLSDIMPNVPDCWLDPDASEAPHGGSDQ